MKIWLMCDINLPDNSKTSDSIIMKFSVLFLHIESDKTTSIYNVSTRVLSKK